MRQGLHNFITFMTDHTISLANERVGDLTANRDNKHYLAVHKYADQEYDSGKEWTDALTKSIMAYIYEAVLVAVTEITVEPRLIPPAGRGALMGLRSRTRLTKSKRQPKSGPFYFLRVRRYFGKEN